MAKFWRNVEQGVEPEPDYERDADVIRAMWRKETEPLAEIDLSDNNIIPLLLEERAALQIGPRRWRTIASSPSTTRSSTP